MVLIKYNKVDENITSLHN